MLIFLFQIAIVQRNAARQRYRPHRRLAGIAQRAPSSVRPDDRSCLPAPAGRKPDSCTRAAAVLLRTAGIELHREADRVDPRLADAIQFARPGYRQSDRWISHPLDVGLGDGQPCQRSARAVISASSCGASTVPRTLLPSPFAVPPSSRQRILSRCGASMVASRLRSFTPVRLISALFAQRQMQSRDFPLCR